MDLGGTSVSPQHVGNIMRSQFCVSLPPRRVAPLRTLLSILYHDHDIPNL